MSKTLKIADSLKDISLWNLTHAKLTRKNFSTDSLNLTFSSIKDIENVTVGDCIELFQNGIRTFYGFVKKVPIGETALDCSVEIEAQNPWAELSETIYQQLWKSAVTESGETVLSPVWRSKIVLGQNNEGKKITVAQQIRDILEYAIFSGAHFTIGKIIADSQMLLDEAKDLTCAEAFSRTLKWIPNSIVYFDYSKQGLPEINVIPKSQTDIVAIENVSLKSLKYWSRKDLELEGVVVKYEREHTAEDFSWITLEEDVYPPNINPHSQRCLVMSVELAGAKSNCQENTILCEPIRTDLTQWWIEHIPFLKEVSNLQITNVSRNFPELTRELRQGNLSSKLNYKSQRDNITAIASYSDGDGNILSKNVTISLIATNAVTGTHNVWNQTQEVEETPIGLAKAIYDAASSLKYEGYATIIDCNCADFFAKRLSLDTSIESPVIWAEEDIANSILKIKFGPPKHLYPNNIAELFRINRTRKVPLSVSSRSSGKSASTKTSIDGDTPLISESSTTASIQRLVLTFPEQSSKVDLDSRSLEQSETVKFRQVYLCEDGFLAKAKILMGEPKRIEQ